MAVKGAVSSAGERSYGERLGLANVPRRSGTSLATITMTAPGTQTRQRSHNLLSEADLAVLEARNEMGDISGADVARLVDAVRYLQQIDLSE